MQTDIRAVGRHEKCRRLTDRMYAAEHLLVAGEYLEGRLQEDLEDWCSASLVSRAMEHYLAAAEIDGSVAVGLDAVPFGDGLAITVHWPPEPAIDAVEVIVRIDEVRTISETLLRGEGKTGILQRGRGSKKVRSVEGTMVLRPVRTAAEISVTTRPLHRLRSETMGRFVDAWRDSHETTETTQSFSYVPPKERMPSVIDVYREAHGQEDLFELIDMTEALCLIREANLARRQKLCRRGLIAATLLCTILSLLWGGAALANRLGRAVPEWVPFITRPEIDTDEVSTTSLHGVGMPVAADNFQSVEGAT